MNTEAEAKDRASPDMPDNPHVLWRQIVGLVLWVGVFSYFGGGIMGVVIALLLSGATFADAWVSGIYKDPSKKSFLNVSPMAWGIVASLLFIVGFPAYLINRNKLRTRDGGNGYFITMIVVGAIVILLLLLNILFAVTGT